MFSVDVHDLTVTTQKQIENVQWGRVHEGANPFQSYEHFRICCIEIVFSLHGSIIVPKKLQSAFGYRLRKNPLWNLKNQPGLWNYDYFSTIQWRPHLIWPSSHKEIWIFVKEVKSYVPFFQVLSLECMWFPQADCVHKRQACNHTKMLCITF